MPSAALVASIVSRRFNPLRDVAGCCRWYDLSNLGTIRQDGSGLIETITDLSPYRRDATCATSGSRAALANDRLSRQCGYIASLKTTGYDAAQLDGVTESAAAFAIFRKNNENNTTGIWRLHNTAGQAAHHQWSDQNVYDSLCLTRRPSMGNPAKDFSQSTIFSMRMRSAGATDALQAHIDGAPFYADTTSNTVSPPSTTEIFGASGYRGHGSLGEILIFNRWLENAEYNAVARYLAEKWSVPLAGMAV